MITLNIFIIIKVSLFVQMLLTSELQMVSLFEFGKRGSDTSKVEIFEVVTKKKTTASLSASLCNLLQPSIRINKIILSP